MLSASSRETALCVEQLFNALCVQELLRLGAGRAASISGTHVVCNVLPHSGLQGPRARRRHGGKGVRSKMAVPPSALVAMATARPRPGAEVTARSGRHEAGCGRDVPGGSRPLRGPG